MGSDNTKYESEYNNDEIVEFIRKKYQRYYIPNNSLKNLHKRDIRDLLSMYDTALDNFILSEKNNTEILASIVTKAIHTGRVYYGDPDGYIERFYNFSSRIGSCNYIMFYTCMKIYRNITNYELSILNHKRKELKNIKMQNKLIRKNNKLVFKNTKEYKNNYTREPEIINKIKNEIRDINEDNKYVEIKKDEKDDCELRDGKGKKIGCKINNETGIIEVDKKKFLKVVINNDMYIVKCLSKKYGRKCYNDIKNIDRLNSSDLINYYNNKIHEFMAYQEDNRSFEKYFINLYNNETYNYDSYNSHDSHTKVNPITCCGNYVDINLTKHIWYIQTTMNMIMVLNSIMFHIKCYIPPRGGYTAPPPPLPSCD